MLELGTHEAVPVARVTQDGKVNRKHRDVEHDRDRDQADGPRDKVADEERDRDAQVAEEEPELEDGKDADGRDREQADPLA